MFGQRNGIFQIITVSRMTLWWKQSPNQHVINMITLNQQMEEIPKWNTPLISCGV
jgi:hypothetical protein